MFEVHNCELSKHWLEYSNCTVTSLKCLQENQEIHFHHHTQACLIHYFSRTRCLLHVINSKIHVRPGPKPEHSVRGFFLKESGSVTPVN